MSRSRVALLGVCGVVGATLLVSPLVNWQDGAPPAQAGAYDPLLSEASCGDTASQLALSHRPEPTLQLASLEKEEIAFLAGIEPAGGEGEETGTGEDGPSTESGVFQQYMNEVIPKEEEKPIDLASFSGPTGSFGGFGGSSGGTGKKSSEKTPDVTPPPGDDEGGDEGDETCQGEDCNETEEACVEGVDCKTTESDQEEDCAATLIGCTQDSTNPGGGGAGGNQSQTIVAEVPEPAALGLFGLGLVMLGIGRRRSK